MSGNEETMTFHDRQAVNYLGRWIDTVDDPQLNWAWDIVQEVIDVYARSRVTAGVSFPAARREMWRDWFAAWDEGEAHFGVHGAMTELQHACPADRYEELLITLDESVRIGETGKLPVRPRRARVGEKTPAAAPRLRLVIDNGGSRDHG
jgi:hypothetical protein